MPVVLVSLPGASSLQAVVLSAFLFLSAQWRKKICVAPLTVADAARQRRLSRRSQAGYRCLLGSGRVTLLPASLQSWHWSCRGASTVTPLQDLEHSPASGSPPGGAARTSVRQTSDQQWWTNEEKKKKELQCIKLRCVIEGCVCWQRNVSCKALTVCFGPLLLPLLRKGFHFPEAICSLQLAIWVLTGFWLTLSRRIHTCLFYFAFVRIPSGSADFLSRRQVAGTGHSSLDDGSSTGLQSFLKPLKSRLKNKPRILLHRDLHHCGPHGARL